MKTLSSQLLGVLAAETTHLVRLWELTLTNGTTLRHTDGVDTVTYDGNTYTPDPGVLISAIAASSTSGVQNATATIDLKTAYVTEADIRAGLLDGAVFSIFIVDWKNANTTYGRILLFTGSVADIEYHDKLTADLQLRGLLLGAQQVNGGYYSRTCRAKFGDSQCTKDLTALAVAFTVDSVVDGLSFVASEFTAADGYFALGRVEWLTGDNAGTFSEVQTSVQSSTKVLLSTAPGKAVQVGDTGSITPGCDKYVETCANRWSNVANFRGEPYSPPVGLNPLSLWKDPNGGMTGGIPGA